MFISFRVIFLGIGVELAVERFAMNVHYIYSFEIELDLARKQHARVVTACANMANSLPIIVSPAIVEAPTFMTTLPRYNNQRFSGRETELVCIRRILEHPSDCSHGISVDGLGGIG